MLVPKSTRPVPQVQRWQSRAEIMRAHLDGLSPLELLRVRTDYYAFRFGWDFKNRRFHQGRLALYEKWSEKAGFRPDQPRWSAGNGRVSGRWSGGAGTGPAGTRPNPGQPTRGGHHFVPRKIFEREPLRPETRRVFEEGVTGPLRAGRHKGGKDHDIYTDSVYERYRRFLRENGIRSEDMTPEQAFKLLDEVKRSSDPRIRDLNLRIFRREIFFLIRRIGRGNE